MGGFTIADEGVWRDRSVPAKPAWRFDRLKFAEVEVADRAQGPGRRAIGQIGRQTFQPDGVFLLKDEQAGDGVGPTPCPAAMIGGTADADDGGTRGMRGAMAGLALGVGHGSFANGLAGHDVHFQT